jgi:Arylsulfotransferase (ASST)/Secretion system C-terminal sorting domain
MHQRLFSIFLLCLLACSGSMFAQTTIGLTMPDSGGYGGYTLIMPLGGKQTYLIDACGREINRWNSDYNPGTVAYLLENGDLLRANRIPGQIGAVGGGGVERRDWDGNLLWHYEYLTVNYTQHHDIRLLPNGNILLLAREKKTKAECIAAGRDTTMLTNNGLLIDYIVELQPIGADSGAIVWEWHMWDHMIQDFDPSKANYGVVADHPELLDINAAASTVPDWTHCNTVAYHPGFDQIIINSRNLSEFWVIDHGTTTAEAAGHSGGTRGMGGDYLYRWGNPVNYGRGTVADQQIWLPHDPHWIEDGLPGAGQILIFDNGDGRPAGQYSTVVAITPPVDAQGNYSINPTQPFPPAAPTWVYQAPNPTDFFSWNISGAQRLPNGNTHICEGATGRIFEVDSLGHKRWEYIVPLSSGVPLAQGIFPTNNQSFRSYRFGPDFPGFAGRDLTPGDRIELDPDPLPQSCLGTGAESASLQEPNHIFPNPCQDRLTVKATKGGSWAIYDALGRVQSAGRSKQPETTIDVSGLVPGIYKIQIKERQAMTATTFVKLAN